MHLGLLAVFSAYLDYINSSVVKVCWLQKFLQFLWSFELVFVDRLLPSFRKSFFKNIEHAYLISNTSFFSDLLWNRIESMKVCHSG